MKVLVTGATGFVGKVVVRQLLEANHEVVVLTRNVAKAAISLGNKCRYYQWSDTNSLPPLEAFENVEGVIHLMGEPIAQRWNEDVKREIRRSRIEGTKHMVEAMAKLDSRPKVFVSTSAIGIYGNRESEEINEASSLGNDLVASICKDWESEANKAKDLGVRLVIIRTGIVLGRGGGALSMMLPIFKLGIGGSVGSGNQYMSWIQIEDLAAMYVEALKNSSLEGPMNGTAPYPATNEEFSKALGKVLRRPTFMPVPSFALRMLFGEMSYILLEGQKVLPVKFQEKHFRYRYPTLKMALKETAY